MELDLLITSPKRSTRRVPLEGVRVSVGRARDNDLYFPEDGSLSRHHLQFERDGDSWWAEDLGSKNGSLMNGARITSRRKVSPGARFLVGNLTIGVVDRETEDAEAVVFAHDTEGEISPDATVMTSLEGVLSLDSTQRLEAAGVSATERGRTLASAAVRALVRAGRELTEHRPLEELFPLILDLSIEASGADRGVILSLEGAELRTRAIHGEGLVISTTVRDRVLGEKASLLVRNLEAEESFRRLDSLSEQRVQTMMAVPLQTRDAVLGLIYVDSLSIGLEFTPDDLGLLTVLANVAATQIEHQRLLALERKDQRRTLDLEQAAEIQRGILPGAPPKLEGLELAGHNAPSRMVGGDYYDFMSYGDGRVGVALGDVAGKGMSAALLMSNLQAMVQILFEDPADLSGLMQRLNQGVASNFPTNRFISLCFVVFNADRTRFAECNAGHNPPFLVRASGEVESLRAVGPVLGVLDSPRYETRGYDFGPGDVLAVYSDGVTESVSPRGEEYGERRLADRLIELRHMDAERIVDGVIRSLREWSEGAHPSDDLTLVVARRLPSL